MSQQNNDNNTIENEPIRTDFEDFDVTFKHDDLSNDDFSEVIIEGRGLAKSHEGEYLENVVLASGMAALQSERFRTKTRSERAAQKALKDLETQSLHSLQGEGKTAEAAANSTQEAAEPVAAQSESAPVTEPEPEPDETAAEQAVLAAEAAVVLMSAMKIPTSAGTTILPNLTPKRRAVGAK